MLPLIFSPIEEIIEEISQGGIVIISDDPERENEADLVAAAELITPKTIAFMANYGRGLICVPLSKERAKKLNLNLHPAVGDTKHRTHFTFSVDARENITTGISAADRYETIQILSHPDSQPEQLSQPGHIFPIQGAEGGVLKRAGHTEASIDLAKMANLQPIGVICEIMQENGEMARVGNLGEYQRKLKLKACTIAALIEYRHQREKLIRRICTKNLETQEGRKVACHIYESVLDSSQHLAFVFGEIPSKSSPLVRVHAENTLQDVMGYLKYGKSLFDKSLEKIHSQGGIFLYLSENSERTHKQQKGVSPYFKNYGIGAQILSDLGIQKMRLISNTEKKIIGLEGYGLEIEEQILLE